MNKAFEKWWYKERIVADEYVIINRLKRIAKNAYETATPKCRPVVIWFAEWMEVKLEENDHKGGWDDMGFPELIERMKDEIQELESVIDKNIDDPVIRARAVLRECADIANFAMMIADNVKLQEPPKDE